MHLRSLALTSALALLLAACGAVQKGAAGPPLRFGGGAPSVDALLDDFMSAVVARDREALHQLRVTQSEYQKIIVPGMVPPGSPPRQISDLPRDYFWRLLDTKSRYFSEVILDRWGGRHYVSRELRLTHPTVQYAWYTVHGEVRMMLEDDAGDLYELKTGSVAEVAGRYKFISFEWDD